ncbi:class I SAM-dependent methyltransferase [Segetibacter sp. 3557_3]|uniref:class I SAM-dependent methyltransferase n=1 Tax=Segetibacter sp. 3557_3 TaxID=2547429 RepID=UPI001A9F8BF0|nr:class I SAM-dependent methyltransferase [Segetibacter sp. 3557_3]
MKRKQRGMMLWIENTLQYLLQKISGTSYIPEHTDDYRLGWQPGHFYSPIPSLKQVQSREHIIWGAFPNQLAGIDLQEEQQLALLASLSQYYVSQPWKDHKQEGLRYYFENPNYSYGESLTLYYLLVHLNPKKVIEIGSGFSSAAMLDINERFLGNRAAISFVEPYPDLLRSLLKPEDHNNINIHSSRLQELDPEVFQTLDADDVLFIDSTHISRIDSDVNHILFTILPKLKSGVYIHFHDIYYPFEYPKNWILQGRAWNEAYILRAFLQYNTAFEIVVFNSFIGHFHQDFLKQRMPLYAKNPGSSLWLRKK